MIHVSYGIQRGFLLSKSLAHWQPLLEEWLLMIERYCSVVEQDAPYWYNERATTSLLAGAAWRCGGIALEEFQTEKQTEGEERIKGRADLRLVIADNWDSIEAKVSYLSDSHDTPRVVTRLEQACEDVKKVPKAEDELRIGVLFCCPEISVSDYGPVDMKLETFRAALMSIKNDAFAWCFPAITRELTPASGQYKDYRYPGLFLLARIVDL